MPQKKRILFGAVDIGHRIETYTKFIQKYFSDVLIPESLSIFLLDKEQYELSYTYEYHFHGRSAWYRWSKAIRNFFFSLFRFDIFHFFSGETLLPRKLRRFELFVYKLFGKRVIMHFVGTDIRGVPYIKWKEKNINQFLSGTESYPRSLPWQKKLIADAEKFADTILVSTPDLIEVIPRAVYYPVMLDLNKFLKELGETPAPEKPEEEIVILHSPSNVFMKGSEFIHEALKKIAARSQHKVRLILPAEKMFDNPKIYSVTRYELFRLYREADIVIDQMIIGWYGLQSIEALAAGKITVAYIDEHLKKYLFPDCPIKIADVNIFETVVEECIKQVRKNRSAGSDNQVEWVKKYHTIENNHTSLLKAWNI